MSSINLIDSAFRRICEIAIMSGIIIRELSNGCVDVRVIKDERPHWSSWEWENKEQFLLGNKYDMSLFKFVVDEYIPYYSFFNHKRYTNFINLCKTLKSCESIEELVLKLDLMGV